MIGFISGEEFAKREDARKENKQETKEEKKDYKIEKFELLTEGKVSNQDTIKFELKTNFKVGSGASFIIRKVGDGSASPITVYFSNAEGNTYEADLSKSSTPIPPGEYMVYEVDLITAAFNRIPSEKELILVQNVWINVE